MTRVAFTAPHKQAAVIGMDCLQQGANAVDAMIAAAAAISVLYPHMNSLAGDGFWLIKRPGHAPVAIDACGRAALKASIVGYRRRGMESIPARGPDACVTVGGTVAGWQLARNYMAGNTPLAKVKVGRAGVGIALAELFAPAISLAKTGVQVTASLANASAKLCAEVSAAGAEANTVYPNFAAFFSCDGLPLTKSETLKNTALASCLEYLANVGLDDFYRGDLARAIVQELDALGSPIGLQDLQDCQAQMVAPLSVQNRFGRVYNLPPPTQGLASLVILAIYDRVYRADMDETQRVHLIVEATKIAFQLRDNFIGDPSRMTVDMSEYLSTATLDSLSRQVGQRALPWPHLAEAGDTVWMGCIDCDGVAVSFIQSIYWEFGAGVVLPKTGLVWNNRGSSFSLNSHHPNGLVPGLKPCHTLNPALAQLDDGGVMVYGTMGGEGQPQTQAALFTRHFYQGLPLTQSIADGRWLLGRTWGQASTDLKMEADLFQRIGQPLQELGHKVAAVPQHSEIMGHAGAIILHPDGTMEAASDPRSDGASLTAWH